MNQFFKFLFASCRAQPLHLAYFFYRHWLDSEYGRERLEKEKVNISANTVLELDFKKSIPEKTNNLPMDPFDFNQKDVLGLSDIVSAIQRAKEDPDIKGIYLNAPIVMIGKARSATLRNALADFRSQESSLFPTQHITPKGPTTSLR